METFDPRSVTHHVADLRGLKLHYVQAGTGPLVLLLHGFPDFWYSWRNQIAPLAAAGLQVVAPDLRGYNLSDKPANIADYRIDTVAKDLAKLIEHLGHDRAAVVGHDWGAMAAWQLAMQFPEKVSKLGILNVAHPERFRRGLRDPRQLLRSWYVFFFQLPWLPEKLIAAKEFKLLTSTLRNDPTRADAFTDDDLVRYAEAFAQPGALTASVNYYRAAVRHGQDILRRTLRKIDHPVLILWGDRDRYILPELAEPDRALVPNFTLHRFPAASHWIHLDEPADVSERLVEFLAVLQPREAAS